MATEIRSFACTIPAGTAQASPVTIPTTFPDRVVQRIEITVPPGPRGTVGFAIGARSQQILPFVAGTWIVTDDEKIAWDLEGQPTTGDWSLIGYNTGLLPHTIYVRYLLNLPAATAPGLLPNSVISA